MQTADREHSLLGKVSLNGWSPVLQVWIQLLHYIRKTGDIFSLLVKSSLVKLETSCTVTLPTMVSVLWCKICNPSCACHWNKFHQPVWLVKNVQLHSVLLHQSLAAICKDIFCYSKLSFATLVPECESFLLSFTFSLGLLLCSAQLCIWFKKSFSKRRIFDILV